jgi:hypothetical protein
MHNEFVVELKDGSRDWVDPVIDVTEDDEWIYVDNGHEYQYEKKLIAKWTVRPYGAETTYDVIGDVK